LQWEHFSLIILFMHFREQIFQKLINYHMPIKFDIFEKFALTFR
jgi:hypothetical protein